MKKSKRVAVIGIHGVGSHSPNIFSKDIVDLLTHSNAVSYEKLSEAPKTIEVTAKELELKTDDIKENYGRKGLLHKFIDFFGINSKIRDKALSVNMAQDIQFTASTLRGASSVVLPDYQYTEYKILKNTGDTPVEVDVQEMHWADLSHNPAGTGFKSLDQFIQLTVHIASLGRSTLAALFETTKSANRKEIRLYRSLYWASAFSYWCLSTPILLGNLLLALLTLAVLPLFEIDSEVAFGLSALVTGLFVVMTSKYVHKVLDRVKHSEVYKSLTICLSVPIYIALFCLLTQAFRHTAIAGAALMTLIGLVGSYVSRRMSVSRPGADKFWAAYFLIILILSICLTFYFDWILKSRNDWYIDFVVDFLLITFTSLVFFWSLLFLANLVLMLGWFVAKTRQVASQQMRAINTALIAVSVPVPLMMSVIILLWVAFKHFFEKQLVAIRLIVPNEGILNLVSIPILQPPGIKPELTNLYELTQNLIDISCTQAVHVYLCFIFAGVLFLAWGIFTAVLIELKVKPSFLFSGNQDATIKQSGNGLDYGFTAISIALAFFAIGFVIVIPFGFLYQWVPNHRSSLGFISNSTLTIGSYIATSWLAASKAFSGCLNKFFDKTRVVIDVAMDVDNWLRERPSGNTPRLRILARYYSLLNHINTNKYDYIVIVAHSQGTVITTDFLRYLNYINKTKDFPPISLLTMGCPLSQLYARRFPHLYAWVKRDDLSPGPDITPLKLRAWINAYGSMDYVGRSLWSHELDDYRWVNTEPPASLEKTYEFCVGIQAHTHYLDLDQVKIAKTIDQLIGD